jgi:hypothetical protein
MIMPAGLSIQLLHGVVHRYVVFNYVVDLMPHIQGVKGFIQMALDQTVDTLGVISWQHTQRKLAVAL